MKIARLGGGPASPYIAISSWIDELLAGVSVRDGE
jgi:hypothetical protein